MLQHRVMQDYDARLGKSAQVDVAMQRVVADVVQSDIASFWSDLNGSAAAKQR